MSCKRDLNCLNSPKSMNLKESYMNTLLLIFVSLMSINSFGQNLIMKNSKAVHQLIGAHGQNLSEEQQRKINQHLEEVIETFKKSGHSVSAGAYACEESQNKLINLENGSIVHDFFSFSHCYEAMLNLKLEKGFCDYTDNTLYSNTGRKILDLFDEKNCQEAIESIFRVDRFCDYTDNTLRKSDGTLLYDFLTKEECLRSLE